MDWLPVDLCVLADVSVPKDGPEPQRLKKGRAYQGGEAVQTAPIGLRLTGQNSRFLGARKHLYRGFKFWVDSLCKLLRTWNHFHIGNHSNSMEVCAVQIE